MLQSEDRERLDSQLEQLPGAGRRQMPVRGLGSHRWSDRTVPHIALGNNQRAGNPCARKGLTKRLPGPIFPSVLSVYTGLKWSLIAKPFYLADPADPATTQTASMDRFAAP
jgi:hypothetical protein